MPSKQEKPGFRDAESACVSLLVDAEGRVRVLQSALSGRRAARTANWLEDALPEVRAHVPRHGSVQGRAPSARGDGGRSERTAAEEGDDGGPRAEAWRAAAEGPRSRLRRRGAPGREARR